MDRELDARLQSLIMEEGARRSSRAASQVGGHTGHILPASVCGWRSKQRSVHDVS